MSKLYFELKRNAFDVENYYSVAFTGRRPHTMGFSVGSSDYKQMQRNLQATVRTCFDQGIRVFYSGMAAGFDLLAMQSVLALQAEYPNIKALGALPCTCHYAKWSRAQQLFCKDLLSRLDGYVILEPTYSLGCMQRRNRYLVDHADRLVACMGKHPGGGTLQTVKLAQAQGKPIIYV